MICSTRFFIAALAIACSLSATAAPLPEGNTGIAARYAGDAGIASDPEVVFVEDFSVPEVDALRERWDTVSEHGTLSFSHDVPAGSSDPVSLCITHVGGKGTGGQLYRRLLPGYDRLFARFYVKFATDCYAIHHFGTRLGGFNPPTRWAQGGAGELPDGAKRFTSGVEPFGRDWAWDFYTYWQGMHVHGDGKYWGTPFLVRGAHPKVERGEWICVEMMLKMNDPVSARNGEQAFWIDGKLFRRDGQVVSHIGPGFPKGRWLGGWWHPDASAETSFEGFAWRSTPELRINYLWTYLYITKAPAGYTSRVWFDNIVVAREYIGPLETRQPSR